MIDYIRYSLPNGLRVIHTYDPSTVMAAMNVLYDTGARDESRRLTGIAHLFEHLMFSGSANVPGFDEELENAGGESNAWTSADFTNFYDVVPSMNAETLFHIESDRMLALNLSNEALEVQRSVVIEEFKQQCLNRPYGDLMHVLRDALYSKSHPYSWPVIGLEPDHIANVSAEDVRQWYYSHYAPNNAVLALAGNIPYDEGRRLIEKWFGDIPRREIARRILPDPGFPSSWITKEVKGNVSNAYAVIAIPMDPYGTHDYRVADCITDILSAGRSSRLINNLIIGGDGRIIKADASVMGSEHPGFMMMTAVLADDSDTTFNLATERLLEQLRLLTADGNLSEYELDRTLNRFESTFLLSNLDAPSKARNLAMAEIHGEDINQTISLQRSITVEDIRRVAGKIADTPGVIVRYRPS